MKILGIISDTHGLLRPEAIEALQGVDLILHIGDIGKAEVITELERIAPVMAVRGNVDRAPWTMDYPISEMVEWEGKLIYMIHILQEMEIDPVAAGVDMVLYGHSHQPHEERKEGVLYLNPGSAGPRRFSLPICLMRVGLQNDDWIVKRVDLA